MDNQNTTHTRNFISWFISANQLKEKVVSFGVLFLEILLLITHNTEGQSILIIQFLNLLFLVYFIFDLGNHFKLEFKIEKPEELDQLKPFEYDYHAFIKLQKRANEAIKQFNQFGGFLIFTAVLYVLLILSNLENAVYKNATNGEHFAQLQELISYFFNLVIHFVSYGGVIYVLKCFYVLYFPTFSKTSSQSSNLERVRFYWFFVIGLIVAEGIFAFPTNVDYRLATFYFEFICGMTNAFILILMFARFESRLLGINPFITLILYVYAILQTALPFVTKNILFMFDSGEVTSYLGKDDNLAFFITLILSISLFAKIIFYNIIVYLYQTKRLFYYFIITKLNYDRETEYWDEFNEKAQLD